MGTMELESKKRARRGSLERAALLALVLAGVAGLAIAAPNTIKLLSKIDPDWLQNLDPTRRLRNVARRLKRKGFIEWVNESGHIKMSLTAKGKEHLANVLNVDKPLVRPAKWDGKWRIVIFDIPERKRGLRDRVRIIVSRFGFIRLQDSVFVYPFDCEEIITMLKNDLSLGKSMLYVVADAIEYDKPLLQHFNLPQK